MKSILFKAIGCALVFAVALPACAEPTTGPATLPKTPQGAFDVYEWVIFVCDPNQPQTNAGTLYQSTLPEFVNGRRAAAPVEKVGEPSPVGVIRVSGNSGGDKVDVLLENKGGRFLANWPKAHTRTNGLLWPNLIFSDEPAANDPKDPLGASSWINQLRSPAASWMLHDGKGEKFLLYDAEPNYKLPLRVLAGAADLQYQLLNNGNASLKDLTLYKKLDDGWHTALLADLMPTKPSTQPTTKPTTKAAGTRPTTLAVSASKPSTQPTTVAMTQPATAPAPLASNTTRPSTTRATTLASSEPTSKPAAGISIALSATGISSDTAVLAPWKKILTDAGLPPTDQNLILDILAKHALGSKRLAAIYRLEAAQMDQLMNLDIVPSPRRTIRVGLVIVKGIDPAILSEIEMLAAQLGDPKWDTREAAHKRLAELGVAAKPKLEILLKNAKDPEVTYRIERLLAALSNTGQPQPEGTIQIDR